MKTSRQRLIDYIRAQRVVSVSDLSRALHMTSANARHHLNALRQEGVVQVVAQAPASGKGRPAELFALSAAALGLPADGLADALLETWLGEIPEAERPGAVGRLARRLAEGVGERAVEGGGGSVEGRSEGRRARGEERKEPGILSGGADDFSAPQKPSILNGGVDDLSAPRKPSILSGEVDDFSAPQKPSILSGGGGLPPQSKDVAAQAPPRPAPAANRTRRLYAAVQRLNELGYQAHWEAHAAAPRVVLGRCPYASLVAHHPVLCTMDARLLEELTSSASAELTSRLVPDNRGAPVCIFAIR